MLVACAYYMLMHAFSIVVYVWVFFSFRFLFLPHVVYNSSKCVFILLIISSFRERVGLRTLVVGLFSYYVTFHNFK